MVRGDPSVDYLAWQGAPRWPHRTSRRRCAASRRRRPRRREHRRIVIATAKSRGDARRFGAGIVRADSALRLAGQGSVQRAAARAGPGESCWWGCAALACWSCRSHRRSASRSRRPAAHHAPARLARLHFGLGQRRRTPCPSSPVSPPRSPGSRRSCPAALSAALPLGLVMLLGVPRAARHRRGRARRRGPSRRRGDRADGAPSRFPRVLSSALAASERRLRRSRAPRRPPHLSTRASARRAGTAQDPRRMSYLAAGQAWDRPRAPTPPSRNVQ